MARNPLFLATIAATIFVASSAWAVDPAARCESQKVQAIGKYVGCLAKLDAKAAIRSEEVDPTDTGKCADKFLNSWDKAQASGDGLCSDPPGADASVAQATAALCEAWAAGYVQGGNADICAGTCDACTADLATCNGDLDTCNADLTTCSGSLATCTSSLSIAQNDLATCNGRLGTCTGELTTCNGNLGTCSSDLTTAQGGLSICNADLTTCTGDLASCDTGLTACTSDLATCDADLTSCEGDLAACEALPMVLKTGQTLCYDAAGAVIACGGTGQDGELQLGAARSFTVNTETITDNVTGLMWEKLTDDDTIHDKDATYTWENAFAKVATLNSTNFAGFDDWRVPNLNELETLRNLGTTNPATYSAFNTGCTPGCTSCSCTGNDTWYWSSSHQKGGFGGGYNAWTVLFFIGYVGGNAKDYPFYVRAVRGGS